MEVLQQSIFITSESRQAMSSIIYHHHHVFCPRAGPSLQTQAPRLQFCPQAGLPLQTQEPRLQFYQGRIGAVASPCFPHPTLSLASEQTLKDLKRSQGHQRRGDEWIWLTGPSGLHRNSPQGLNITSIRVFDQIRDPEIPVTLRPRIIYRTYLKQNICFSFIGHLLQKSITTLHSI